MKKILITVILGFSFSGYPKTLEKIHTLEELNTYVENLYGNDRSISIGSLCSDSKNRDLSSDQRVALSNMSGLAFSDSPEQNLSEILTKYHNLDNSLINRECYSGSIVYNATMANHGYLKTLLGFKNLKVSLVMDALHYSSVYNLINYTDADETKEHAEFMKKSFDIILRNFDVSIGIRGEKRLWHQPVILACRDYEYLGHENTVQLDKLKKLIPLTASIFKNDQVTLDRFFEKVKNRCGSKEVLKLIDKSLYD